MPNDTITNAEIEEILTKAGWDSVTGTWTDPPTATTDTIVGLARALLEARKIAVHQHYLACQQNHRYCKCRTAERIQKWEGK